MHQRGLAVTTVIIVATVFIGLLLVGFLAFSFVTLPEFGELTPSNNTSEQEVVPSNPTSGEPVQPNTQGQNTTTSHTGGGGGGGGGGGSGNGNTGGSTNNAPSAVIMLIPGFGPVPLTVMFNASNSSDPDNDPLSYVWTFENGTDVLTNNESVFNYTFSQAGIFEVNLSVSDGDLSDDDNESVSVSGVCGNSVIEDGEECDANNLGGLVCSTVPSGNFTGGSLSCTSQCTFNTTQCTAVAPDTTPPQFTQLFATPSTYTFSQSSFINATITDNIGVDSARLEFNNVNYTPGRQGNVYFVNHGVLATGVYSYRWFANDTNNNINLTTLQTYTIAARTPSLSTLSSAGNTFTYGVSSILSGSGCPTQGAGGVVCRLFIDNNLIANSTTILLGAGSHALKFNSTANQNYSLGTNQITITVNQIVTSCNITASSPTITYPNTLTVSGSCSNLEASARLYRNGVDVTSQNGQVVQLAVGTYNYTINVTGTQNYTSAQSTQLTVTVNRASPSLSVSSSAGNSFSYGTSTNLQGGGCPTQGASDVICRLFVNNSLIANPSTLTLGGGASIIRYNTTGGQNYTSFNVQQTVTVNPIPSSLSLLITPSSNVIQGTQTNATGSNCPSSVACSLTRNGLAVSNPDIQTLGVGTYTYNYSTIGNANYTSSSTTQTLVVNGPSQFTLTVTRSGNGSGSVTSNPNGINCGLTCQSPFNQGTLVTLTATSSSGSIFTTWSGACSGSGTCAVNMTQIQNVNAQFSTTGGSGSYECSPYDPYCRTKDANGWTNFTPSVDSHIIYVSSVEGSDSNNCDYTLAQVGDVFNPPSTITPCRTVSQAKTLLYNVGATKPTWILFARGAEWKEEPLGHWTIGGRSASEPMVIGSYRSATRVSNERPLFNMSTGNGLIWVYGVDGGGYHPVSHLAIIDLAIINSNASLDRPGTAFGFFTHISDIHLENNYIGHMGNGFDIGGNGGPNMTDFMIRRNIIGDIYADRTGGLLLFGENVTLEENVWDHNGFIFRDNYTEGSVFSHHLYIGNYESPMNNIIVRNNIFMRGVDGGKYTSYNLIVENNTYLQNAWAVGACCAPNSVIRNNIVIDSHDITSTNPLGYGFAASPAVIDNNILAHEHSGTGNIFGIGIERAFVFSGPMNVTNNIVYAWCTPSGGGTAFRVRSLGTQPMLVENNQFQQQACSNAAIFDAVDPFTTETLLGLATYRNNHYALSGSLSFGIFYLTNIATYAQWVNVSHETGSSFGALSYLDSDRDAATYMNSLFGTSYAFKSQAGLDAFAARMKEQSKWNWNTDLTSSAFNAYIRTGFLENLPLCGPLGCSPPDPENLGDNNGRDKLVIEKIFDVVKNFITGRAVTGFARTSGNATLIDARVQSFLVGIFALVLGLLTLLLRIKFR